MEIHRVPTCYNGKFPLSLLSNQSLRGQYQSECLHSYLMNLYDDTTYPRYYHSLN